jgi:hypothetical protein
MYQPNQKVRFSVPNHRPASVKVSPRQKELIQRAKICKIDKDSLKDEESENFDQFSGRDAWDNPYSANY